MVEKAPDAFRTISEVAGELDVPQHVLRFWETRFSHIKPMKRGGGRRYYRPADVDLLRGIKHLLYGEGYTIKGVQRILKEDGIKAVQSSWQEQDDADALDIGEAPQPSVETSRSAPVISRTVQPAGTAPVAREQVVQFAGIKPAQMSALTDCLKSLKECRAILKEAANV